MGYLGLNALLFQPWMLHPFREVLRLLLADVELESKRPQVLDRLPGSRILIRERQHFCGEPPLIACVGQGFKDLAIIEMAPTGGPPVAVGHV